MSILDKALYYKDEWATIYCGDNRDILPELSGIDLVITSPPYDDLREYNGGEWDFETTARDLSQVLSVGGIIIWVVGDATIDGSETGSSFKQALYFKEIGLNLHDTMIYAKQNPVPVHTEKRYNPQFEYMFCFSKGIPRIANLIKEKQLNSHSGKFRQADGALKYGVLKSVQPVKPRNNIWFYIVGTAGGQSDMGHPAQFPEALASDHIISWSNPNDLVLDPFLGSGTTCYCAKKLNRRSIGIEINEKYCEIAKKRLSQSVMIL